MFEPYIQQCVITPSYAHLEAAYLDYGARSDSSPCKAGVANQCAVRMSIALYRAGMGLEGFPEPRRVHSGNRGCETGGVPHVLGAEELANFLATALGQPQRFRQSPRSRGCAHVFAEISGQHGILYFNNCFTRAGDTVARGDHIDLFNGTQYFNQILHPSAGGDETTGGSLFGRADSIRFWALS